MSAFNNIIPILTSDTAPSGQAFSSGILSASYLSFYAFTSNLAQSWTSSQIAYPHYLGYKFDSTTEIGGYSISSRNLDGNDLTAMVRDWELEGSNDGFVYTKIDSQRNVVWASKGEEKIFQLKEKVSFSYFRIKILSNNGYSLTVSTVGRLQLFDGKSVKTEKKLTIKSASTDELYSLSDNTLIHLPDNTTESIIEYGLEQGKYIQLDVPFDKHKYFNDTPVDGASGKVFTHNLGVVNTLSIKEFAKNKSFEPIYTWYETRMTSNTSPSPLVSSGSSLFNSNYDYYKPFNGTNISWSDSWASNNPKAHLQLDFNEIKKVNIISITTWNEPNNTASPKRFSISASTNGTDFETILNEITLSEWAYNTEKIFFLNEDKNYRVFRINIEESFGASYVSIGKIKLGYKREVN
ncbi:discoidin domain-containing protein [Lysinibacillus fusiformis]|uniref:discoidin domain-containing protein n=1 Tax=Lysinibacillus fusiformis TaxID=28031 RepID=UPI001F4D3FF8|nr:discoidin domain-containing protein [Lysinibacillus fusiformis]MCK1987267.1 discoidin domain-containing protein [Lysinibacillus fusiformis]